MQLIFTLFTLVIMLCLTACEQEPARYEQQSQPTSVYSREALDKIEKEVNQSTQKSLDRLDSALNSESKQ